jgi:hypothetical protein
MKTSKHVVIAIALFSLSTKVFAQAGARQDVGRRQGRGNYNPATEVTFNGIVDEVQQIPAPGKGQGGLHLMVRSDGGMQEVHVGPAAYVASKHFELAKGEAIVVTGSKVKLGGQDVILAREIKKGNEVLTLRDPKGFPLWSGRARRSS